MKNDDVKNENTPSQSKLSEGLDAKRKLRAFAWLEKHGSVDLIRATSGRMIVDVRGTEILEVDTTLLGAIEKAMSI